MNRGVVVVKTSSKTGNGLIFTEIIDDSLEKPENSKLQSHQGRSHLYRSSLTYVLNEQMQQLCASR